MLIKRSICGNIPNTFILLDRASTAICANRTACDLLSCRPGGDKENHMTMVVRSITEKAIA